MTGLLIKDLPAELHQKLRDSAALYRRSITKEALVLLENGLNLPARAAAPPIPFRGRLALTQDLLDEARADRE